MQQTQKYQSRGMNKRQFSSPISLIHQNQRTIPEPKSIPKPAVCRKTDYSDDHQSQLTNSQVNFANAYHFGKEKYDNFANTEKVQRRAQDRGRDIVQSINVEDIAEKESRVVQLRERLNNIHHFYRVRIEQERNKNIQRSEIFIGIIEQLQVIHGQKLQNLQREYVGMQEDEKEIEGVDTRMSTITKKIAQISEKSEQIKQENQALQLQIEKKRLSNDKKQKQLQNLRIQIQDRRQNLEYFEKLRLKQNRRSKELLELVNNIYK